MAPIYFGQPDADRRQLGRIISLTVTVNGATGETRVNDTTAGNQTFPDVSMAGKWVVRRHVDVFGPDGRLRESDERVREAVRQATPP